MLAGPSTGSAFWELLYLEISESGKNRSQIVAHWECQSAAAFHY